MVDISAFGMATAFAAGIVSFMSPCVLPLVPAYLSYVGAGPPGRRASVGDGRALRPRLRHGVRGAGLRGGGRPAAEVPIRGDVIGGLVIIAFGLLMLGVLRRIRFLQREMRPGLRPGARPAGAFTLGVAFGFGWTPRIGPVLGAILTYSAMQGDVGSSLPLLASYAAGLGVPFLLSAAFLRESLAKLKRFRRAGPPLQVAEAASWCCSGLPW